MKGKNQDKNFIYDENYNNNMEVENMESEIKKIIELVKDEKMDAAIETASEYAGKNFVEMYVENYLKGARVHKVVQFRTQPKEDSWTAKIDVLNIDLTTSQYEIIQCPSAFPAITL